MKSESSTSPAFPAANLIDPPPRSAVGGIAVICVVVAILSAHMVAPRPARG